MCIEPGPARRQGSRFVRLSYGRRVRPLHSRGDMIDRRVCLFLLVCARALPVAAQPPATTKEPPPLWDIQIGASFVGTSGNSETASIGGDFAGHRRGALWRLDSSAVAVRIDDRDELTAERYIGTFRSQRKLSPLLSFSSGIKLERDRFSGIDFRSIVDGGLGWALVRRPTWMLDGVTGVAWNHEAPVVGPDHNDPVGLFQLLSRIPFVTGDTTQRITFYPNFSNSASYRSEAEASVQAAMNSRLALKVGHLWRYSHDPIPGFKRADNTTTASVVLRWKASAPAPAP